MAAGETGATSGPGGGILGEDSATEAGGLSAVCSAAGFFRNQKAAATKKRKAMIPANLVFIPNDIYAPRKSSIQGAEQSWERCRAGLLGVVGRVEKICSSNRVATLEELHAGDGVKDSSTS